MKTTEQPPSQILETSLGLSEKESQRLAFLTRMRQTAWNELKYTFTFPKPGEGLTQDIALKAGGLAGAFIGKFMYSEAEKGHLLRAAGQSEQSFNHMQHGYEHMGAGVAVLGAASLLLANRVRSFTARDRREREDW